MPFSRLIPSADPGGSAAGARPSAPVQSEAPAANPCDDQAPRDRRHAERDRQLASLMDHFAKHPAALAKLVRDIRMHDIRTAARLNAEANHDYVEGFEERWADERGL